MNITRYLIVGVAIGAMAYIGVRGANPKLVPNVAPTVAPVLAPIKKAPLSAKTGGTSFGASLAPVPSVTVVISKTPIPYTTITPSATPISSLAPMATPTIVPTRTPMPTVIPTVAPTATPTMTPGPTPTPTDVLTPTPTPGPGATGHVVINEIGWMGTEAQANDEWIELYNDGDSAVDLSSWKILIAGDTAISLPGSIVAHGYYLLERTSDTDISDVSADYVGTFGRYGLSNAGEHLTLIDGSGVSIDDVNCASGWFAGVTDKGARASMERVSSVVGGNEAPSWSSNNSLITVGHDESGQAIRGTPRSANSVTL